MHIAGYCVRKMLTVENNIHGITHGHHRHMTTAMPQFTDMNIKNI
jgi:hypothetical protein